VVVVGEVEGSSSSRRTSLYSVWNPGCRTVECLLAVLYSKVGRAEESEVESEAAKAKAAQSMLLAAGVMIPLEVVEFVHPTGGVWGGDDQW